MDEITYSKIKNVEGIEILRDKQSFNYTFDNQLLDLLKKNFSLENGLYLLASSNDAFAGFCSIDKDWWEDGFFFIREILVDPKFYNQQVGYTLMNMCLDHAQEQGAVGVVTETDFENIPMQRLCQKVGFKKWDNPKWKDGITYKLVFDLAQ